MASPVANKNPLDVQKFFENFPLIELKCAEGRGRYLVAKGHIKKGEEIFGGYPWVWTLDYVKRQSHCSYCFSNKMLPGGYDCKWCHQIRCCSPKCAKQMEIYHTPLECLTFRRIPRMLGELKIDPDFCTEVRGLLQILANRVREYHEARGEPPTPFPAPKPQLNKNPSQGSSENHQKNPEEKVDSQETKTIVNEKTTENINEGERPKLTDEKIAENSNEGDRPKPKTDEKTTETKSTTDQQTITTVETKTTSNNEQPTPQTQSIPESQQTKTNSPQEQMAKHQKIPFKLSEEMKRRILDGPKNTFEDYCNLAGEKGDYTEEAQELMSKLANIAARALEIGDNDQNLTTGKNKKKSKNAQLTPELIRDLKLAREGLSDDDLVNLLVKARFNCFGIREKYGSMISATGVYISCSFFNHSCIPNLAYIKYPDDDYYLSIRALRDISPGEELAINYMFIEQTRDDRRQELLTYWGFNCACPRCALIEDSEEYDKQVLEIVCPGDKCRGACVPTPEGDIKVCNRCYKIFDATTNKVLRNFIEEEK